MGIKIYLLCPILLFTLIINTSNSLVSKSQKCGEKVRICSTDLYNKAHDYYQINDIFERHKNITPDYKVKACIILRTVSNCLQKILKENRNCSLDMYLVSINGLTKKRMNNFTCSKKRCGV